MTDQPGYALDEAMKLLGAVRRRMKTQESGSTGDVWSEAVRGERPDGVCPHNCPACRAYEAARESGPDVLGHVVDAGQSLFAAFQDLLAGYERSRPAQSRGPKDPGADQGPIDIG